MWPFKRGRQAAFTIDPFSGDETAHAVDAAARAGDWRTVRDALTGAADPDRKMFYLDTATDLPGEQPWITEWAAAEPQSTLPVLARGAHAITWAWEARTSRLAKHVSPEQWKLFAKRLKLAENCLDEVTERDPDDPTAWCLLLTTAMGRSASADEELRRFEQVIARDRWHASAHSRRFTALCAKWGGSHQAMHEFAERTVAEMPTGHGLGWLVPAAHLENATWSDNATMYFAAPAVLASLHAAADRSIRYPPTGRSGGHRRAANYFALLFHLAGDNAAAAAAFDLVGDRPTLAPWDNMRGDAGANFVRIRTKVYRSIGRAF